MLRVYLLRGAMSRGVGMSVNILTALRRASECARLVYDKSQRGMTKKEQLSIVRLAILYLQEAERTLIEHTDQKHN